MRIISGKFKNKKILLPSDKLTRPLKDIVRESIFNVIEHSNLIENEILTSDKEKRMLELKNWLKSIN